MNEVQIGGERHIVSMVERNVTLAFDFTLEKNIKLNRNDKTNI